MPTPELGRIETVKNIRDIWKYEDDDFTPWLAGNLNVLGEALGMELQEVKQEAAVGPFSLDILAREVGRGVNVAIENQLAWTDHSHLGQLLTYAAGYDARVVVWVTPHFQDEHRAAIDWLNRWTPDEIEFYAVEVRAIRIGDSLPAPEFRPVAFPNGWTKERLLESSGLSPSSRQFRDFFQPLVDELRRTGFTDRTRAYARYYQHFPPSRFKGIEYGACFYYRPDIASVYVSIDTEDKDFNKRVFDALEEQFRDFFQPLVDELRRTGFTDRTRAYARYYQHFPPSRFKGIEYGACFYYRPDIASVYVSIDTEDKEFNKRVFDALKEREAEIQTGIDGKLEWRRNDAYRFSTIDIRRDGSMDDPQEKLEEIRAWMLEYLPKLKEVLDPHLERVLKELQPEGPAGAEA